LKLEVEVDIGGQRLEVERREGEGGDNKDIRKPPITVQGPC
jgi:hypothetical protein